MCAPARLRNNPPRTDSPERGSHCGSAAHGALAAPAQPKAHAEGFPMINSPAYEEVALTDTLMFKVSRKPASVIRGELRITELGIGPLGYDDKQYLHPVI